MVQPEEKQLPILKRTVLWECLQATVMVGFPLWLLSVATPNNARFIAVFIGGFGLLWTYVALLVLRAPLLWTRERKLLSILEDRTSAALCILMEAGLITIGFSIGYWMLGHGPAGCFNEPLDKVDALYFALVTLSTTGFGDIHAVSGGCRALVSAQIVVGVVLLSVVLAIVIDRMLAPDNHASTPQSGRPEATGE